LNKCDFAIAKSSLPPSKAIKMTHVPYDDALLKNLNGKVAIITGILNPSCTNSGGAQGIGASAVEIFVNAGAKVVFADMNVSGGKSVENKVHGYPLLHPR
jgi:hypothetical protein